MRNMKRNICQFFKHYDFENLKKKQYFNHMSLIHYNANKNELIFFAYILVK